MFTGPNGIYGNMVVLDHGLGLMSLYAHLSDIGVKVGQTVQKGEALGRSGQTGLAGGDHLHFALLIHGVYTSPIEWWDSHWLKDRIAKPLVDAGITLPGITDGVLAAASTSGPAAPPAARSADRASPALTATDPDAALYQERAARPSRMTAATVPPTATSRRSPATRREPRGSDSPAGRRPSHPQIAPNPMRPSASAYASRSRSMRDSVA